MNDELLKTKIKKLAGLMEENTLLDYEYDGYMEKKETRDIFRPNAKHKVFYKKKLAYIDQMGNGEGNGGWGRLLVATDEQVSKNKGAYPKGSVFTIKAYGQKNRYIGDIDKVLKETEENNKHWIANVMERARKRRNLK